MLLLVVVLENSNGEGRPLANQKKRGLKAPFFSIFTTVLA